MSPSGRDLAGAWPGCMLVVDARGHMDTAVWGGVLTHAALVKGVSALVVDGSVRDVDEIRQTALTVFTRGVVPNGPHKGFGGSINTAISCAGVAVNPGDLVVGDADGVKMLAKIPPRDVLLAQLMGTIQAPLTGFAGVLTSMIRKLVGTLQAVADSKEDS